MTVALNPHSPTLAGFEWFPFRQRGLPLSQFQSQACVLTPGAITTDDLMVNLRNVVGYPHLTVEIDALTDLAVPTPTVTRYAPSGDAGFGGAAHAGGGTSGPFYVDVDEDPINLADYVTNGATTSQVWSMFYGASGFPSGRRVLGVTVHFELQSFNGFGATTLVNPWFSSGGAPTYASGTAIGNSLTEFVMTLPVNPVTHLPWTQADIVALASTSVFGFDLYAPAVNQFRMYQAWMEVTHIPETRLAVGNAFVGLEGWKLIGMTTPSGTDTWTPAAATAYAVILGITGPGSASWRGLDSGELHPSGIYSAPVTITSGYPAGLGTTDDCAPGVMGVDGSAAPLWGQPFVTLESIPVDTTHTVQQEITLPDTASRGWLRFTASQASIIAAASLVAKVKRRSDNVQVGGDVTVAAFDVRGAPQAPQLISLAEASGAAGTAVQHYVEWSSTAATGLGWLLYAMGTEEDPASQLLVQADQDFETSSGLTWNGSGVARVNSNGRSGAWSLNANHSFGGGTSDLTPSTSYYTVFPGSIVAISGWIKDDGANHKTSTLEVNWLNSSFVPISTTVLGTITTTGAYQQIAGTVSPPPTAVHATLTWRVVSASFGTGNWYGDDFSMTQGGLYATLGFNGGIDRATVSGVEQGNEVVPVLIGTTVASPSGLTVVAA